jgi:hypothetical protein
VNTRIRMGSAVAWIVAIVVLIIVTEGAALFAA